MLGTEYAIGEPTPRWEVRFATRPAPPAARRARARQRALRDDGARRCAIAIGRIVVRGPAARADEKGRTTLTARQTRVSTRCLRWRDPCVGHRHEDLDPPDGRPAGS